MNARFAIVLFVLAMASVVTAWGAKSLTEIKGCTLVPTDWADGDSFRIRTPDGEEHTVRLYGADCLESHVTEEYDVTRLRTQRRYFGITKAEPTAQKSIALAKEFGRIATVETRRLLGKPFTVHTSFADGRGDPCYKRVYGFVVTSDGEDLASVLVSMGLARAFGVSRETPDGQSRDDYQEQLQDLELRAAKRGKGAWARTDWESLPEERKLERVEEAEAVLAIDKPDKDLPDDFKIDINTASRDELMRFERVGEVLANRIIEGRPYTKPEDLLGVDGIGTTTLKRLRPHLKLSAK